MPSACFQIRLGDAEFGENFARSSSIMAELPNRRFQFHKRSQLFVRVHDESLSVVVTMWSALFTQ
jgi:hypothetical protein